MPQMLVDLHCDALLKKENLTKRYLNGLKALNLFQCFAAFVSDENAAAYAAAKNLFYATVSEELAPVRSHGQLMREMQKGTPCCAFTCENIGFTKGNRRAMEELRADGVIMASLVWNAENSLAYPNVRQDGARERRGLKDAGRRAVEYLDEFKIIVDISHLSDGGVKEIIQMRAIPVVASHSCCNALSKNVRNLTDIQLKKIAKCGGAVGVNFYKKFLGGGGKIKEIAAHIKHIIKVAGEDTPSFGSDFFGVPEGGIGVYPHNMPKLLQYLADLGLPSRVVEKVAYKNFLRVFKDVCG